MYFQQILNMLFVPFYVPEAFGVMGGFVFVFIFGSSSGPHPQLPTYYLKHSLVSLFFGSNKEATPLKGVIFLGWPPVWSFSRTSLRPSADITSRWRGFLWWNLCYTAAFLLVPGNTCFGPSVCSGLPSFDWPQGRICFSHYITLNTVDVCGSKSRVMTTLIFVEFFFYQQH